MAVSSKRLLEAETKLRELQDLHATAVAEHEEELETANARVSAFEARMLDVAKAATAATAAAATLASNTDANASTIENLVSERDASAAVLEQASNKYAALKIKFLALKAERDLLQRTVDNDPRVLDRVQINYSQSSHRSASVASAANASASAASPSARPNDGPRDTNRSSLEELNADQPTAAARMIAAAAAPLQAATEDGDESEEGSDSAGGSSDSSLNFNASREFEEEEAATLYAGLPSPLPSARRAGAAAASPPASSYASSSSFFSAPLPRAMVAAVTPAPAPALAPAPAPLLVAGETPSIFAAPGNGGATNTAEALSESSASALFVPSPNPRLGAARSRVDETGVLPVFVGSPTESADGQMSFGPSPSPFSPPLQDATVASSPLSRPDLDPSTPRMWPEAGGGGGGARDQRGRAKEFAVSVAMDSPTGSVGEAISSEYLEEEAQYDTEIGTMLAEQAAALHSALAAQVKGMVNNK